MKCRRVSAVCTFSNACMRFDCLIRALLSHVVRKIIHSACHLRRLARVRPLQVQHRYLFPLPARQTTGSACKTFLRLILNSLTPLCSGDSYTQTQFEPNGTLPSIGNPLGNPPYPVCPRRYIHCTFFLATLGLYGRRRYKLD